MKQILIAFCLLAGAEFVAAQGRAPLPMTLHKVTVIAHRGDHTQVPENTLAAYQHAIAAGVDYVEVDLRTTSDGRLMIMHDETVDRTTNGKGRLRDLTYQEIRTLKVVDKKNPGAATCTVPTFEEVLNLCKGKINIYLDFKDADVQKVYKLLKASGMLDHVAVYLNAESHYVDWKAVDARVPLISSVPGYNKDTAQMRKFLQDYQVSVIDGSPGDYDEVMLSVIRSCQVKVWLDVQNKEERPKYWMPILKTGVDGMQSDHPGALVKFLGNIGRR